jgi:demethylmenaquinone methyltransferase/2-methoxy-6-polyprenyl-1,4-benzoquinol methylase
MRSYYQKRAPTYDAVYEYPERQRDLRFLERYTANLFSGLDVLEVAAGTGYWTAHIASQARSVLATDVITEALEQIHQREIRGSVRIKPCSAYLLTELGRNFNGAFAGLWISHVPKQRLCEFLETLHQVLLPGATVLFIDNSPAQCRRLPLSHTDEHGNTYQDRVLEDGSTHRILKNFPTQTELLEATRAFGSKSMYRQLENFWMFRYSGL